MTRGSIMIQSYGMNIILSYSLEEDKEVFLKTKYTFAKDNEHTICISTCTVAGSKESNEDAFSVIELDNSLVAAVFDGTSSLKPIQVLKDQTGARFASHFLKNELERGKSGPTINTMIRNLNKALLQKSMQFEDTVSKDIHTLPASTATLMQIIPDKDTIHLSHIGDSFCIVFFTDAHSEFMTIDRNRDYDNKMFELMKKVSKEKNVTPKEARQDERVKQALLDMFQDTHNRPDGTGQGIINGDPNAEQYIQDISLPLSPIQAILLGTDGLIPPGWDEQNEADRKKLFAVIKKGGLEELIRIKKETEDNDPDRYIVRYKHSDDATGIFMELN